MNNPSPEATPRTWNRPLAAAALCLTALVGAAGCPGGNAQQRVVLYCAQDEEFAKGLLQTFHERTGLEVVPKFDTEAGKSVELYLELMQEKDRPRCDVFWNNEV